MKQLFLFFGGMALCSTIYAQPIITANKAHIKLTDAIAEYKLKHNTASHDEDEKNGKDKTWDLAKAMRGEKETDYRFNHWLWYWQRHTDDAGYLVPPTATWQAWQHLQNNNNNRHANERTTSSSLTWTFSGPDSSGAFVGDGAGSGVGRINVVAFHPTDSNTYCIGSPGGGAWKTTNNGTSWQCLTDQLPNLSVGDIKYNPLNANTMYLCSGDRDGSDYYGIGVLKSYDGGTTWNTTGMIWADSMFNIANCILVNPLDTNSLILGTTAGLYRSYNGGASWAFMLSGNFIQLLYRPNDTNIVYAGMGSSSATAQVYRSHNGGTTWVPVTSFVNVDRVAIAVTPANPNIVKALCSTSSGTNPEGLEGIYSSSDTGHTFTEVFVGSCSGNHDLLGWAADASDCGGQGWYDLPIAISPLNANLVYIGGVNAWSSTDGGTTWSILNQWTLMASGIKVVHADKHSMVYNPLCPTRFFETNDGGIYNAYNPTSSGLWKNLTNGLGITEFYGVATTPLANWVIAGAQDVGSKLIKPSLYEEADGGDGTWSQIDNVDITSAYTSSPGGYIDIIDPTNVQPDNTANDISGNILGGSIEGGGAWVTPFLIEPTCHTCLIAGYQSVYRTTDKGNTWTAISPGLASNSLLRLATTLADSNTIYASENSPSTPVHYTHNMGGTWTNLPAPYAGKLISDIKVDPRDKDHIWATFSGYGSHHVSEWHLATGWQTFDAGLPDVPVHCIAINPITREMYVGTEIGVFYRDSTMAAWVMNSTGMPAISVTDIEINTTGGEIWASTYGRSLWHALLPTNVVSVVPFVNDGITIAPNPNNGNFDVSLNNITDKRINMRLIDITGKTVWEQKNILNIGSQLPINTQGLVNGAYILEVSTNSSIAGRQKVVISR